VKWERAEFVAISGATETASAPGQATFVLRAPARASVTLRPNRGVTSIPVTVSVDGKTVRQDTYEIR
jgi:hypothetical protein